MEHGFVMRLGVSMQIGLAGKRPRATSKGAGVWFPICVVLVISASFDVVGIFVVLSHFEMLCVNEQFVLKLVLDARLGLDDGQVFEIQELVIRWPVKGLGCTDVR